MRWLVLVLLLGCGGPPEPAYQLSCENVVCNDADIDEQPAADRKRCGWCFNRLGARVVTFRLIDGCWNFEREFDFSEQACIQLY